MLDVPRFFAMNVPVTDIFSTVRFILNRIALASAGGVFIGAVVVDVVVVDVVEIYVVVDVVDVAVGDVVAVVVLPPAPLLSVAT